MSAAQTAPLLALVAGPNGAGKSTCAPLLLREAFKVNEFINADTIAAGLSAFRPASVAVAAGRIMLERMRYLAAARESFAFETTLATRTLAPWLSRLQRDGYHVHLVFVWLKTAELAVTRVAERVRLGGHHVPSDVVRRRYGLGLQNLFRIYMPLVDSWQLVDNSEGLSPAHIATGDRRSVRNVTHAGSGAVWRSVMADDASDTRSPIERVKDIDLVQRTFARAVRRALIAHKQAGNPICVWRDGEVVWIPPEEIEIPPEPPRAD